MTNAVPGSYATISFYQFAGWRRRWKAFKDMGMRRMNGDSCASVFHRQLGSGAGQGFSLIPDWSTYIFLAIWPNLKEAHKFLSDQSMHPRWINYATNISHLTLHCYHVHGHWDQQSPFCGEARQHPQADIVVLTRATIRKRKAWRFWQHVPASSRALQQAKGKKWAKGMGEWPFIQQATVSIWESEQALHQFAYQSGTHKEIVAKTRKEKWYREELFARFELIDTFGTLFSY